MSSYSRNVRAMQATLSCLVQRRKLQYRCTACPLRCDAMRLDFLWQTPPPQNMAHFLGLANQNARISDAMGSPLSARSSNSQHGKFIVFAVVVATLASIQITNTGADRARKTPCTINTTRESPQPAALVLTGCNEGPGAPVYLPPSRWGLG